MNIKRIKLKENLYFTRSYSTWPPPESTRFVRSIRGPRKFQGYFIHLIGAEFKSEYRHALLLHSYVYCAEILGSFTIWILTESFVGNVVCDISSLPSDRWSAKWILLWVVRFYKLAVAWRRKLILNYFILYNRSPEEWMCAKLIKVWSMN
jgi:hypothetical protein